MLTVITPEQAEQWDRIVRSFQEHDAYWLSGYVEAFRLHGDGDPLLFFYEGENTRGINVVMRRDIAKAERFQNRIPEGTYYDFTTPYGYGGWIIEGPGTEKLFREYERWAVNHGIVSEFVRFHPLLQNQVPCSSFYEIFQLGEIVPMDLSSPETIWENMSSKNRNMIRKAVKNGIRVYNGRFPEAFDSFRSLYGATAQRDRMEPYYHFEPAFFTSILNDLPHNAQVFWAEKDGETVAASIFLTANGRMNYHLSGSLQEFNPLAPGNLILHTAALWGNANGYRTLNLGGGVGSREDSLFQFKRAFFKGNLPRFHIGKKIFAPPKYEELCTLKGATAQETSFFPEYRA